MDDEANSPTPSLRGAPNDPDEQRTRSNLKGASAFMPVGVTPREDELALIESLARNQVS